MISNYSGESVADIHRTYAVKPEAQRISQVTGKKKINK